MDCALAMRSFLGRNTGGSATGLSATGACRPRAAAGDGSTVFPLLQESNQIIGRLDSANRDNSMDLGDAHPPRAGRMRTASAGIRALAPQDFILR